LAGDTAEDVRSCEVATAASECRGPGGQGILA
jgi:hypothetical protein